MRLPDKSDGKWAFGRLEQGTSGPNPTQTSLKSRRHTNAKSLSNNHLRTSIRQAKPYQCPLGPTGHGLAGPLTGPCVGSLLAFVAKPARRRADSAGEAEARSGEWAAGFLPCSALTFDYVERSGADRMALCKGPATSIGSWKRIDSAARLTASGGRVCLPF